MAFRDLPSDPVPATSDLQDRVCATVSVLLEHKANVDAQVQILYWYGIFILPKDVRLWTPLWFAVRCRLVKTVQLLMGAEANVNHRLRSGVTMLHEAAACACFPSVHACIDLLIHAAAFWRGGHSGRPAQNRPFGFGHRAGLDACPEQLAARQ